MLEDILKMADELLESIGPEGMIQDTDKYYLRHHVGKFRSLLSEAKTRTDAKIAIYGLRRYGIDSMDWQSHDYKRTSTMTELADKYAKTLPDISQHNTVQ